MSEITLGEKVFCIVAVLLIVGGGPLALWKADKKYRSIPENPRWRHRYDK